MKTLCIVPARGGSKRLPGKNMRKLDGKPLIFHTLDVVIGQFDKVVFSSDDIDMVRDTRERYNENEGFVAETRLSKLAGDTSKVIDTVLYYANQSYYKDYTEIWLCLPTCPLRTKEDVEQAKQLLDIDIDSVVSITDFEFPPSLGLLEGAEGLLGGYDYRHPFATGNSRSQDHQEVFRPNGAIYGTWRSSLIEHKNYYRGRVRGYYMPRERSVDIDNEIDFCLAEAVIKSRGQQKNA